MNCHICTRWTPEKGCDHYGPTRPEIKRPFNVHLLIDVRTNPDQYGIAPADLKGQRFRVRLYRYHHMDEFNYGWDGPSEPEMIIRFRGDRSMTWKEYKKAMHNYREWERERSINDALSLGVKR